MKPIKTIDDPRYIRALSHPLRVRLLALLEERAASPRQLADLVGAKLGVVAYHVRTLERLGLVELVEETRVRGAIEHHYRSLERPKVTDQTWADASPVAKQAEIGASLQLIHEYASAAAAAGGFDDDDRHLSRIALRLDSEGASELGRAVERLMSEAERIGRSAAARMGGSPPAEESVELGMVAMLFEAPRSGGVTPARR